MNLTPIISIIIGLLFVWIVLSLAVMYLGELVAARFSWRATMLEATIRNMLSDAALADQLYNHPLIRSLYSGPDGSNKPSYIPASQFSQALLDIVTNAGSDASLIQEATYRLRWELPRLNAKKRKLAQKQINVILALTRRTLVSEASQQAQESAINEIRAAFIQLGSEFPELKPAIDGMMTTMAVQRSQIQDALENNRTTPTGDSVQEFVNHYRTGMKSLSVTHPRLKQTLSALLSEINVAGAQPDGAQQRARENLEQWFNNSMDRLSGWYRRRAQTLAYTLAILLALMFNIDSLSIATKLWREPMVRNLIADQATAFANQNPQGITNPSIDQVLTSQTQVDWVNLPVGWIGFPVNAEGKSGAAPACGLIPPPASGVLGLPVLNKCYPVINIPALQDLSGWLLKLFGIVITGVAAAQGAPFWFDLLKRLINVRISGANPVELNRAVG